jgi:cyclic pyranopterin monophosphate synthase
MSKLSHLDEKGAARMVDVSDKAVTHRTAKAEGFVAMKPETLALIETGQAIKGDVLATARIAGIMAAKKTHELIPLCHPLPISKATVDFQPTREPVGIRVVAEIKVAAQTGVEMEALTAVSVACLTIYDMVKAADKSMSFSGIRLLEKTGGRSGTYRAADAAGD